VPHYIKRVAIFGRKSCGTQNVCFEFLYMFCLKHCHSKKYPARYYHKCMKVFRYSKGKDKGKAIPLQAWTGPEGSRRMRFPDFKTIGT
jgi:hypothetical protein